MSKEEIYQSLIDEIPDGEGYIPETIALKAMDEYAKEQMAQLIENISRQPIQCYSQKISGQEKQFFLGRQFVEDLIKRIKKQ